MIEASAFWTFRVQISIFAPKPGPLKPPDFMAAVYQDFQSRYDGKVFAQSEIDSAEFDMPVAFLRSKDNSWELLAFKDRIYSTWSHQLTMPKGQSPENLVGECLKPILAYVSASEFPVGRFGVVLNRAFECEHPSKTLIKMFCNEASQNEDSKAAQFRHSREFQIHNLKRYLLPKSEVAINSWVRCKCAKLRHGQPVAEFDIIECEQDLNTQLEEIEKNSFCSRELEKLILLSATEADSILRLYFPDK